MQVPPEIAFRKLEPSDALKEEILDGIDRLEAVYPDLISCRVVVADDTPGQQKGSNYRVRLDMSIPNHDVVVVEDNSEPGGARTVEQTIRDAFQTGRSRLKREKERQQGDVKTRDLPPHGRILRLLTDEHGVRYGFLEDREGRQIYFHEEALVDLDYADLEVGDEVRIALAAGDKGPQASTVAPLDPDLIGPRQEEDIPLSGD